MISNLPDIIFLSGFMGAGKSTVGRALAERLECNFLDLDDKIEEDAGQKIPEIFEQSGEPGFRTAERRALLAVARNYKGVVALGGGSLQNQHLVDHLKLNGLLVFIETPISVILDRISGDENRPLLLDDKGNPKSRKTLQKELQDLYDERLPLYEQAVITVTNDGSKKPEELVQTLLKKIKNHVGYY
ncbi:shikimate kinase [Fodinibius halophilus]|uniref:Shikimate kinase n=1 Tax=Fodinibius halophilus TaxID=1736908 RepID=A0A6M1T2A6_9BACT|nr:shikimate kinase [Fodinibius halophilus]NGP86763.1 shikimate kinase [Fodinibius halophilus]